MGYISQGDMFRPSRSSSGPPRKQIQELFKTNLGSVFLMAPQENRPKSCLKQLLDLFF